MAYFEGDTSLPNVLRIMDFYLRFDGKNALPISIVQMKRIFIYNENLYELGKGRTEAIWEDLVDLGFIERGPALDDILNIENIGTYYGKEGMKFFTDQDIEAIKREGSYLAYCDAYMAASTHSQEQRIRNKIVKGVIGTYGRGGVTIKELTAHPDLSDFSAAELLESIRLLEVRGDVYSPRLNVYCAI